MITYFSFLGISIRNFIYELQSEKSKNKIKKKRLTKLLRYAKNNSKFYKKLYKDLDITKVNFVDIPSVSKHQLMSNFDDWVTKDDVSFKEIQDFTSDISNIGKKFKKKYFVYQTSGSTGSPITIVNNRYTHDVAIGTGIVKTWPGGIKTWYNFYKKHKFAIKSTIILPFDIFSISSFNGKEIVSNFPKKKTKKY